MKTSTGQLGRVFVIRLEDGDVLPESKPLLNHLCVNNLSTPQQAAGYFKFSNDSLR